MDGKRAIVSSATHGSKRFWPEESSQRAAEVMNAGTTAGFSKDQIRRAKHRIGAVARREGFGVDGGWFWKLGAHPITR
jgi:hypothetical protein